MMVLKKLSLTILLLSIVLIAKAQPQPPDPNQDPDAVPITGLEYLLVTGGVYGVSRLLKKGKGKEESM